MNKKMLFFLVNSPVWMLIISFVYIFGFRRYLAPPEGFVTTLGDITLWSFSLLAVLFSSFYIFYSYLIPKYWRKDKRKNFLLLASLTILIIEPVSYFVIHAIPASIIYKREIFTYPSQVIGGWFTCSTLAFLASILGVLCKNIFDSVSSKESKKDLEHKNLQSELSTLKSKLNPHLLFNSINNIDSLILTNPEQASAFLSKLSDLLRYVVYETEDELVSINKEISNLNKYIDLETIRLINPECISFTSHISNNVLIPPMLFFPFVENGFKHSNLNKEGQKLQIAISEDRGKLVFECTNTVMEKPDNKDTKGVGLMISRKRLRLLFPGKHELKITEENNEYSIKLQINLN
ncbi:sensor histidine kinase [Saccharicrinis aurantiacus]|uniref:sensor histidine kinase n=1 Tax=Saccharicrinis aurantiacus TaxID=1849719 RepID=UPI00094F9522|nr:histidine kinase [Saccharicrinis aurantiacus]